MPETPQVIRLTPDDIVARLKSQRDDAFKVTSNIDTFREYASGKHLVTLNEKQKKQLGDNVLKHDFCDNLCDQVITEAVGRIALKELTCQNAAVKAFIDAMLVRFKYSARLPDIAYTTLRDGNHAVGLKWNNELMRVEMNTIEWWNGKRGVFIDYDDNDNPLMAVNEYPIGDNQIRRSVFLEDFYYVFEGAPDNPTLVGSGEWVKKDGTPLHIPIIHFRNIGKGIFRNYGVSELFQGIVGQQDHINDAHWSMLMNTRNAAYRMHWAAGVSTAGMQKTSERGARDVNAEFDDIEPGPGNFITSKNKDARFGSFEQSDVSSITEVFKVKIQRLGQNTQTPTHYISGGDWPSGDALIRAEMPAIDKARNQIELIRLATTEVFHRSIEIYNTYNVGGPELVEDILLAPIQAIFYDPEKRDMLSLSAIVKNLGEELPLVERLKIIGFTEEQAQEIAANPNLAPKMATNNATKTTV